MTKAVASEQNMEREIQKHMGCMAGFLQLFDRHHISTTKRLYSSAKSLPSSPATEMTTTTSESEKSTPPSPPPSPPAESIQPKSQVPITIALNAGAARSAWKFGKEAPRLSLDSRAVTDSKGCLRPKAIRTTANTDDGSAATTTEENQHQNRSPSVIARLMGLEPPPPLDASTTEPELRRCASDSRAAKDLFFSRFEDFNSNLNRFKDQQASLDADPIGKDTRQVSAATVHQRKCFFYTGDVFPEPKKTNLSRNHGEIESRFRMRGLVDQPPKDLEALRQILEALQLKGLLHSQNQIERRNFVYDESPAVAVKSSKSPAYSTPPNDGRFGRDSSPKSYRSQPRRSYGVSGEISPSISPRRERNASSPVKTVGRNEGNRRSNSLVKPYPLSVDVQRRRVNQAADNRRVSPVNSPRLTPRRTGQDQTAGNSPSPRCKKPTAEIYRKEKPANITTIIAEDESSSLSDYSYSTSTDTERSKTEEYRDGKNILERSAKLLRSISEMTTSSDMQPSPVSVLDSSFYKDDSFTPSPVTTRRHIELKEDEQPWSPAISPIRTKHEDIDHSYISDIIIRASHYENSETLFSFLEKQQFLKGFNTSSSEVSKLQRKLTFDVINEIIERNKQLPPWKAVFFLNCDSVDRILLEFRKLQDREKPEDLFEAICGVLKEDFAGDDLNGWRDCYAEVSSSVLDIERMIFKDLISDAIAEFSLTRRNIMVVSSSSPSSSWPRRKLVF